MTIISSTVWDSGSTTWDSGSSLWDPHRQIDGTVDSLALAAFGATVTRPPIEATTATLTLSAFTASITRPPINVTLDTVVLTSYDTDVDYERLIMVGNLPSLVMTKSDTEVTLTSRNLTFFLSPVF
jgi:hypothetical protein